MTLPVLRTSQKANEGKSSAKPPGAGENDRSIVLDFIEKYGNFIWALAKRFTNSTEEAEAATQEIFIDIWNHAETGFIVRSIGKETVALIARRRLLKCQRDRQIASESLRKH